MGIYRGAGGSGDAVNDASSEALITIQARDAALAAQAAAELARDAAQLAETNAETAETNAETAETNAETAATNAAASASAASTSASNAATSATNAANSATAAQTAETNAETAETNAAASASAASTSASNAATSATNASNSASAAATSATNASNSASAAATSATNAANSATAAQTAQTAAELAETNAETAEANAEAAQAAAETAETNAETAATNAANSASAAATSATNASNSASAAATSATNASNSASAAAASASNAATSESNAASSASAAAASYDSFDDRYLGAKSSAPTLDNDGNTLLVGALYYDTVSSSMKVWSGSAWLDAYASLSGALLSTNNLSDLTNTATARDNLGVEIGVDVQAYDAQLADIAGLTPADNNFIVGNGTNFVTESGSAARTSLGLGSIATQDANNVTITGGSISGITDLAVADGGTGASDAATARSNLGLVIGTNVQAWDADLDTWATKTAPSGTVVGTSDSQTLTNKTLTNPTINGFTGDTSVINIGSGQVYKDTSGNVGIGTSSPSQKLHVVGEALFGGDATYNNIFVNNNSTTGGGGFTVQQNGSSRGALTVSGAWLGDTSSDLAVASIGSNIRFYTNNSSTERMRISSGGGVFVGGTTAVDSSKFQIYGAKSLSAGIPQGQLNVADVSAMAAGVGGAIAFSALYDGTNYTTFGSISGVRENGTSGNYAGSLIFNTRTNGGNNDERMRIDSSGRVGIGTTPSGADGIFNVNINGTAFHLGHSGNFDNYFTAGSSGTQIFRNASTERMRITSGGNVSIGTTSAPQALNIYRGSGGDAIIEMAGNGTTLGTASFAVGQGGDTWAYIYQRSNSPMLFATNNTERMRLSAGGGLGVGTTGDPGAGGIFATGNITAYYSDKRLKTVSGKIENALDKVNSLSGVYYTNNDIAKAHGYTSDEVQVGVLAQEIEAVLPEIVKPAPFDLDENGNSKSGENYKTVQYDKLVPLLIEAIKELKAEVDALKGK